MAVSLSKFNLDKFDKLSPFVFFLILVWLTWRLASLVWWFVLPPQAPVVNHVVLGSQQKVLPDIVRFSLFEEQKTAPQAQQQANLPMKLEGVMLANPRYLSSAVIRVNNKASSYRVGQTIEETHFNVAEVYWDRVIVSDPSGQTQELLFGEQQAMQNNAPSQVEPQNQNDHAIGGAIDNLQNNRDQYLAEMGVQAGQGGFEISERTPPALRARLGLKPGDKIVSVNGQPLASGMNEAQLLEQIRKTGQAKIEIQRGEQTLTIQQNF